MRNYKQAGHGRNYTNGTGSTIAAGGLVVLRSGASGEVGVAINAIANGASGQVRTSGVFTFTKAAGAIAAHALVYRNSSGEITGTASGNTYAGINMSGARPTATGQIDVLVNGRPGGAFGTD